MLFDSFRFIFAFGPAFVLAFFALRRQRLRVALVVVASYVFYGLSGHLFPLLLAFATLWSWAGGLLLARAGAERRLPALWAAIAGPLATLVAFKYAGFVANDTASVVQALTGRGLPSWRTFARGVVLPVGISFYTFEAISYVVDIYRGRIEAERDLLRYAAFMAFFPHLVAGPIVRYERLGPQLARFARLEPERVLSGLVLFSAGLAKKVLVADNLALYSDPRFANPSQMHLLDGWLTAVVAFTQVYFDFAGYTDMALGIARIVGIDLPWNFDRPQRAASPTEFWTRWNVTLSRWLRDYVYVPLNPKPKGERRRPRGPRRDLAVLLTMGIAGLWHGASMSFLLWGLYMGALAVTTRRLGKVRRLVPPRPLAIALTYVAIVFGGIMFRVHSVAAIPTTYAALLGLHGLGTPSLAYGVFVALLFVYLFTVDEEWRWRPETWVGARFAVGVAGLGALAGVAFVWMLAPAHPFVYFQF
jgi:alginate O-acetyltransferase complex protein AlgI